LKRIGNNYIKNNLIIEGDDISPKFIKKISKKSKNIKHIALYEDDKENIRKNILNRNRHLKNILKDILEKNIDFIFQDNLRILRDTKKLNLNILPTRPFKTALKRTLKIL